VVTLQELITKINNTTDYEDLKTIGKEIYSMNGKFNFNEKDILYKLYKLKKNQIMKEFTEKTDNRLYKNLISLIFATAENKQLFAKVAQVTYDIVKLQEPLPPIVKDSLIDTYRRVKKHNNIVFDPIDNVDAAIDG